MKDLRINYYLFNYLSNYLFKLDVKKYVHYCVYIFKQYYNNNILFFCFKNVF